MLGSLRLAPITSKSLPALILRVLASFVNSIPQSWPATQSCRRHEPPMATVRTETTRGPTYSMTRAIEATPWRKGSSVDAIVIVCVATIVYVARAHSGSHSSHEPTSPMATLMSMSARVQPQCRHILQSTWYARPVCMQQPYRPGMTCMLD